MRHPLLLLLLLAFVTACAQGALPSVDLDDDDSVSGDDDDVTSDDDDIAPDDDDIAPDDDDIAPDDDDIAPDDDDIAPDDDDIAPDDDDIAPDDDDVADDDDVVALDSDGDGWAVDDDCDDGDPSIHPDAPEVCDAIDQDCDGDIDEGGCPDCTWEVFDGHTYQFCEDEDGWVNARDQCIAWGYQLVTVNGEDEDEFLEDTADTLGIDYFWIGYNDRGGGNEGTFTWTGAPGSGYENWAEDEPNNDGNEDCVEKWEEFDYEWNDFSCGFDESFVCEVGF